MVLKIRRARIEKWFLVAAHLGSLLPLSLFGWATLQGQLGFNPVETALRQSGRAAVSLLILSLAMTPLRKIFKLKYLHKLRKPFGLYAALYASLHFTAFALWDYGLNLSLIWQAFIQKPYLLIGLGSLVILLILTVTSNRFMQVRLRSGWRWLQRAVYLAAALAIAHYLLAVKGNLLSLQGDYTRPLIAAGMLLILFLLRVPRVYRPLQRWLRSQ